MSPLQAVFSADIVAAIEQLVDERVAQRLAGIEERPGPRWLYTDRAAATYLGWPLGRVQKLSKRGLLPCHRLGGGQRKAYRTDELDAALGGEADD